MAGAPYDPVELRGRIVVCFSVQELRALADTLGVTGIAWDRGAQDGARDLVRHFERQGNLSALVAELRRARPLVEWPEAKLDPDAGTELTLNSRPPPPLIVETSPVSERSPVPPSSRRPSAPVPSSGAAALPSSRGRAWPGLVTAPEPTAQRGIDPRILLAVGAMTIVAAVIAFAAGRASSSSPTAASEAGSASAATPAASNPAPRRADGPAVRAADAFARGLANVGRACELPRAEGDVLRGALEQCGPRAAPTQPVVAIPPPIAADPQASAEDDDPTRRVPTPTPDPPLRAPGSPCIAACDGSHRACNGRCGPEPTQSSKYADHQ